MKSLLLIGALLMGASAFAGELDQDMSNQGLRGTVIMRVDTRDNSISYVKTDAVPANEQDAKTLAAASTFMAAPLANVKTELDQVGGASSWYWYCGPQYPNYLNWYGYNYYPTYSYTYMYYSYTYFWFRWW